MNFIITELLQLETVKISSAFKRTIVISQCDNYHIITFTNYHIVSIGAGAAFLRIAFNFPPK